MDKCNIKQIVKKIDYLSGNPTRFARMIMWGCALFCAVMHIFIIMNINADNLTSIINIFTPYYLLFLNVQPNIGDKVYSVLPIKRAQVDKELFKQTIITCAVWLLVVVLHNVAYMSNPLLYDVRGMFGVCLVISVIQHITRYIAEFVCKNKYTVVLSNVLMIVFVVSYLVMMFLEMSDTSMTVLKALSAVFGMFSGYVAIGVSVVISLGIILHFYLIQSKKERSWKV